MSDLPISIMGGGGAPVDASYVVVALTAGLTSERRINAGTGIAITDNGANSTIDIALSGGGGAGVAFVQGGNTFGAIGTLGTNDNNDLVLERNNTSLVTLAATALQPFSNDLISLGVSGTAFSDLFLASGGVVNFGAGEVTLTSAADLLTLGGGDFQLGGNVLLGNSTASGTLTLRATSNATDGAIIFQSDPTTETARMTADPVFLMGRTSASATSYLMELEKDQNNGSTVVVENATGGTAAGSAFQVDQETVGPTTRVAGTIFAHSTTYTTSGMAVAGALRIAAFGGGLTQISFGTVTAFPITFWTNNVEEMRLLSGGGLMINATAKVGTEELRVGGSSQFDGNLVTAANADINMSAGGRLYGGGVQPNTQTLAANTNLVLDENDSCVTVTTGAVSPNTITLPAASGNQGMIVSVYVTVDAGQNCNVVRAGADVIQNGSADLSNTQVALDDAGDYVLLQCVSSTEWQVVVNSGGTVT